MQGMSDGKDEHEEKTTAKSLEEKLNELDESVVKKQDLHAIEEDLVEIDNVLLEFQKIVEELHKESEGASGLNDRVKTLEEDVGLLEGMIEGTNNEIKGVKGLVEGLAVPSGTDAKAGAVPKIELKKLEKEIGELEKKLEDLAARKTPAADLESLKRDLLKEIPANKGVPSGELDKAMKTLQESVIELEGIEKRISEKTKDSVGRGELVKAVEELRNDILKDVENKVVAKSGGEILLSKIDDIKAEILAEVRKTTAPQSMPRTVSPEEFDSKLKNAIEALRAGISKEMEGRIGERIAKLPATKQINPETLLAYVDETVKKAADDAVRSTLTPMQDELRALSATLASSVSENREKVSRLESNVGAMMDRELERARLRREAKEKIAEVVKVRPDSVKYREEAPELMQASANARTQKLVEMIERLKSKEKFATTAREPEKTERFKPAAVTLAPEIRKRDETGGEKKTIRVKVVHHGASGGKSENGLSIYGGDNLGDEEKKQLESLEKQKAYVMGLLDELVAEYTAGLRNGKEYGAARSDALRVLDEINEKISRINGRQ